MARNLTVSRPYARAIFSDADQNDTISSWSSVLQVLAFTASEPSIDALLNDPKVSRGKWLELFVSICEKAAPEPTKLLKDKLGHLLKLLIKNKRLKALPDIQTLFQQLLSERQGTAEIEAISAFPLSKKQCVQLQEALEERLNSKVRLDAKVDETLIGGILMRSRSWVLDASIRGQLARFKQTLLGLGGR